MTVSAVIYGLVDPREPERIRYVGKTIHPTWRVKQHLQDARAGQPSHRCKWIRKLLSEGTEPQLITLEVVPEADWEEAEIRWIAKLRQDGHQLTNGTDGGGGIPPEVISQRLTEFYAVDVNRERLRRIAKASWETMTPEQRQARVPVAWNKGVPATAEARARLNRTGKKSPFKGKRHSSEAIEKNRLAHSTPEAKERARQVGLRYGGKKKVLQSQ